MFSMSATTQQLFRLSLLGPDFVYHERFVGWDNFRELQFAIKHCLNKKWAQFDPKGTKYIRCDQLSDFLDSLDPPLQLPKPNKFNIIQKDFLINKGDMIYRQNILDPLLLEHFHKQGFPVRDTDLEFFLSREGLSDYVLISSTRWRMRENYAARLIQHAWRNHKNGISIRETEYGCRFICNCPLSKTASHDLQTAVALKAESRANWVWRLFGYLKNYKSYWTFEPNFDIFMSHVFFMQLVEFK